ncbi:MAG: alpha/beta fold hydrolase [Anaerolineales bacterium]|jgi:carboxylesterase|nr:alpha/beta fold hydrolase [Anaerolineales bacterium]
MLPIQPFQAPEHQPFYFEGGQPAALLVHGFPGTPLEMRATGETLHQLGFTAKGILLPGFGSEIENLPKKTAQDWLDALLSALEELRRDHSPLLLVGNSMGSALSLAAATQAKIDGLIVYAPFWKFPGPLWASLPVLRRILPQVKPMRILKPDFNNPQFRAGLTEFLPGIDIDAPAVREQIINFALPIGLFDEIRKAGQLGYQAIPHQAAPTLILQGRSDNLVNPKLTRANLRRYPVQVTYAEFEGGHDLYDPSRPAWDGVREQVRVFAKHLLQN